MNDERIDKWIDAIESVCCWESLQPDERQRVREILEEAYEAGRSLERKEVERLEAECRLHVYEKCCLHDDLQEARNE